MILETAAVEDNFVDLLRQATLGDEFADLDGGGYIGPVVGLLAKGFLGGIDAGKRCTSQIVDDLGGDVLA